MPGPAFLEGERVELRTVEEADVPFLQEHVNDPAVWRYFLIPGRPITLDEEREWVAGIVADEGSVRLLVCVEGSPVGLISLKGIDRDHGVAELGYWVAPDEQNRGYATEATELVVEYAFDHLRIHKLHAGVLDFNDASARVLEKNGFEHEGTRRESVFVDGAYHDRLVYGLVEGEWRDGDG